MVDLVLDFNSCKRKLQVVGDLFSLNFFFIACFKLRVLSFWMPTCYFSYILVGLK